MKKQWISLGGYRGYYQPVPPEGYELLLDCSVVNEAMWQLKKILTRWLRSQHIRYQSGLLRTSNVFSAQFYIIVEKNRLPENLRQAIENWFVDQNCETFSIFTGESWELDTKRAQEQFNTLTGKGGEIY